MKQAEVDRLIKMRISPINISVHTTNPDLRCKMLSNRFAGDVLSYMQDFKNGGISMNCQIVLCKGVNDGAELERTIRDLQGLYPAVQSVSIVPIGLTRYRDGLVKAETFDSEDAKEVISLVEKATQQFYEENGTRLIYLSDEFYLNAGYDIPPAEYYESFPQIENGVGMVRTFIDNFIDDMEYHPESNETVAVDIATGESFYPVLKQMTDMAMEKYGNKVKIYVHKVKNEFFGGNVSVTGLLTGTDLVNQLKGNLKTDRLCLCRDVLSDNADIFLDDMTVPQLENQLGTNVEFYSCDGYDLLSGIMKEV
jgi:putative radical SAM enzyme (TIGR03279 family)